METNFKCMSTYIKQRRSEVIKKEPIQKFTQTNGCSNENKQGSTLTTETRKFERNAKTNINNYLRIDPVTIR